MFSLVKVIAGRTRVMEITPSAFDPWKTGEVEYVNDGWARIWWDDGTQTAESVARLVRPSCGYVLYPLSKIVEFAHGQHAMHYPQWIKDEYDDDADQLVAWGEEVIIEEVIDPRSSVAVRPLNSDAVFTVHPDRLSHPYGAPCQCARVGGDAFPC